MRILWLCNGPTTEIAKEFHRKVGIGWIDGALNGLRRQRDITVALTFPLTGLSEMKAGTVNGVSYYAVPFSPIDASIYWENYERFFADVLAAFQPDIIHIWGTEFCHSLAMVRSSRGKAKVVVSIQGLCSYFPNHFFAFMPEADINRLTFRDLIRRDTLRAQKRKWEKRGQFEIETLRGAKNVIGRTDFDKACTEEIDPGCRYYLCNETLRDCFYDAQWDYDSCIKHSIFCSAARYPIKGFHLVLQALPEVLRHYPDTVVYTTGQDPFQKSVYRMNGYDAYIRTLIKKLDLRDHVFYLESLSQEEMLAQYLSANVFVMASSIENSPNSLGEAMLAGTPCVASDVGGVSTFLEHRVNGYVYQADAPYMLAYYIKKVFADGNNAAISANARLRAAEKYDRKKNAEQLMQIYSQLT